ncbi:MAG TPA: DUF1129 family protein [Bacillaceae bacterium]
MNAKKLIEENNRKREQLTPENEAYYSDMLLYIRLQLTLSEQQSEEVLMEMLDHLLDGQKEGKTARDIFGDDPKAYADEIIQQLPKEERRAVIPFLGGLALNLFSWFLIIRGIIVLIVSQFKDVDTNVYIFPAIIVGFVIVGTILLGIWFIFGLIKKSLFQEKPTEKSDMVKAGLLGSGAMGLVIAVSMLLPDFGPSFAFSWRASFGAGVVLWLLLYVLKKRGERVA